MSAYNPFTDFEQLLELAKQDPQAFEDARLNMIEKTIQAAPEKLQLKLRQLQWKIDGIKVRAKNSLDALFLYQDLMREMLLEQQRLFQQIADLCEGKAITETTIVKAQTNADNVVEILRKKTDIQ